MIKTIIFDIGGVLIGYDWTKYMLELFNNDEKLVSILKENIFKNWDEVDRGILSEKELLNRFAKDIPELEPEIKLFWNNLGDALWQYDFTKGWLTELKSRGYQLLFLSNWSRYVRECATKQMDFLPLFDGGVFSYKVKLIKPDLAIYREIIRRYNLNSSECVFLDDKFDNCNAAKECGMKAVHVINHEIAVERLELLLN